jgi:formylmethanofuran dehydrogenase subunit A
MRRDFMSVNIQKTTAEIDLMDNKKMYVVKDGQLIEHDLPDYGEVVVTMISGKTAFIDTKVKRKI